MASTPPPTLAWFKSSHSGAEGGDCVEVAASTAATWRKSSHSGAEGGQCVEVANGTAAVHIRDSKNTNGPMLTVAPDAWAQFVALASGSYTG
jgi:hypothetical protein